MSTQKLETKKEGCTEPKNETKPENLQITIRSAVVSVNRRSASTELNESNEDLRKKLKHYRSDARKFMHDAKRFSQQVKRVQEYSSGNAKVTHENSANNRMNDSRPPAGS